MKNNEIYIAESQLDSPAMRSLSPAAFRVYLYMRVEADGNKKFTFPRAKYRDWCSPNTFERAKKELITKGFIVEVENNAHLQKANVYEFSEGWKEIE